MAHTQYQQFIATLLLVSISLQSCGNPNWKLEEADSLGLGAKASSLKKAPDCISSQSSKPSQSSENKVFVETSISYSEPSDEVAHEVCSDCRSTSLTTPVHSPAVYTTTSQHTPTRQTSYLLSPATTSELPGHALVSTQHATKKSQSVVQDEGCLARHKPFQHTTFCVVTPLAFPKDLAPIRSAASSFVTKSTSFPLSQSPSSKPTIQLVTTLGASIGPFALASGQEIVFSRVADHWQARVKDMWNTFFRETTLPVIGKEDLSVVLHNLQGQEAVHMQRRIHILETDQPPWAPRVVYVGAMGLRGGMEKEARQVQEQTDTVHASKKINRVAPSDWQLHKTSDKEQDDAGCQAERRSISLERRRQNISINATSRLASTKDDFSADHEQKKHAKERAKEQNAQGLPPNGSTTAWHPPFVARPAPTPVLPHFLQNHLRLHAQSVGEGLLLVHAPAVRDSVTKTQLAEDVKLPSIPRVTTLSTPEEAQSVVETYLERWRLETLSGRAVIWEQGQGLLKNVEALKKETKRSYRRQVLGFEINDIDPLVWNRVLQQQKATREQLKALRCLRTRLLSAFQLNGRELQEAGIRTAMFVAAGEAELYSSDEEAQQLSDQSRKNHAAFVVGIGKVLQGRIEELLALFDDAIGTTLAPYIALLSSTPELPALLEDYTANFLHEIDDEERKAELLGSLFAEVILQFVPLPKIKKAQLNGIKHKLGQAARRVALQYSDQLKESSKKKNT